MSQLPDTGWVAVVKRDCPTCELTVPVLAALSKAGGLTVYTQDYPAFPENLPHEYDSTLDVSHGLKIEIVPTLLRRENGREVARTYGWDKTEWRKLTGLATLGEDLPDLRPGCGAKNIEPGIIEDLLVRHGETGLKARKIEIGSAEDEIEAMFDRGWSDGLPVVPPTEARVLRMLAGTARDPHHFDCLIGFGATAVYPYLVYQTLHAMAESGEIERARDQALELGRAYRRGIRKGLFKILSKMGISTVGSYRGAQLFELVGLADEVVDKCFSGAVSRIQGADFDDLWSDQKSLARWAWNRQVPIEHGGLYRYVNGGEFHAWNPDVTTALRNAAQSGEWADYQHYARLVNDREPAMFRDLLRLRSDHAPIPIEEVEPAEAIVKRFDSAGMSLGALSPEAHEAIGLSADASARLVHLLTDC